MTLSDYFPRTTKVKPQTFNGIEFKCWYIGIANYEWRDATGERTVRRNFNKGTYSAYNSGVRIGKRFLTASKAMAAAAKA